MPFPNPCATGCNNPRNGGAALPLGSSPVLFPGNMCPVSLRYRNAPGFLNSANLSQLNLSTAPAN